MYRPPVMLAAQFGYPDALRFLLERGAEVDAGDYAGETPLIHALLYGQGVTAQILIAAGADVDRERNDANRTGDTPLLMLIRSPHFDQEQKVDLIRRLTEAGANVNKPNVVGDTPLLTAVRFGTDHSYQIIGSTDKAGNVVNRIMLWPVYDKLPSAQIAALIGVLRAAGADADARDRDGKTARDLAREAGLAELASLL